MGLTSQGYEVLDAPNGRTGLELLGSFRQPDLQLHGNGGWLWRPCQRRPEAARPFD
jgi:hypothetical protein